MRSCILAVQADHHHTQHIHARPEQVFPLLCPVREHDWIPDWRARMIHTHSGVAEADAVFATPADAGETVWIVCAYEPPARIRFVRFQPEGVLAQIHIAVEAQGEGASQVHIRYCLTATRETAEPVVQAFTSDHWQQMMQRWQDLMNAYLAQTATP